SSPASGAPAIDGGSASGAPHSPQNRWSVGLACVQVQRAAGIRVPHARQNLFAAGFSASQAAQSVVSPDVMGAHQPSGARPGAAAMVPLSFGFLYSVSG